MRERWGLFAVASVIVAACNGEPEKAGASIGDGGALTDSGDAAPLVGFISSSAERVSNPAPAAGAVGDVAAGNTAFALDLFQKIRSPSGNVAFSPFSVSMAMAMVWAGSQGTAAQEIATVLHFTRTQDETHTAFNYLDQHLENASNGFVLHIANSLWLRPDSGPKAPFLDTLATNYGAGVHVVDLTNGTVAAPAINDWVSQETSGKITGVVSPEDFDTYTRLALANAIYLNGKWEMPFDPARTVSATFTRPDGSVVSVPTMNEGLETRYSAGVDFQAAELRYQGTSNPASMVFIVPTAGQFEAFTQSLDATKLGSVLGGMTTYSLGLSVPRFRIDPGMTNLADALSRLGMQDVFENVGMDFSSMAELYPTKISKVRHHAILSIDEQGTEAAAATVVIMARDGGISTFASATLQIDRPFLFLLRDLATGTVLFLGQVVDPS